MYRLGGRKIALFGLTQIGCTPLLVSKLGSDGKPCVQSADDAVNLFNVKFKPLVDELNKEKSDARFTFINTAGILYPQGSKLSEIISLKYFAHFFEHKTHTCITQTVYKELKHTTS